MKIFDYIFIARPVLFYPVWTVFLAGYIVAERQMLGFHVPDWNQLQWGLTSIQFWATFLSLTLTMGAVFIINQFTDVHTDRVNNKLFLIANGLVSKKIALAEIILLLFAAFIISINVSTKLFLLILLLLFTTGIVYSLPPFYCKDRPYSGWMVNLAGGLLTFLIGWSVSSMIVIQSFYKALPYIFAIGGVYFLSTIPDLKGDKNSGKITVAVKFGPEVTIILGLVFNLFCIFSSIWQKDWVILFPASLSLVTFFRLLWQPDLKNILMATRIPILLLSIATGIFFPFYFVLMLVVFIMSKCYYFKRFNLNYPSLSKIQEEI